MWTCLSTGDGSNRLPFTWLATLLQLAALPLVAALLALLLVTPEPF